MKIEFDRAAHFPAGLNAWLDYAVAHDTGRLGEMIAEDAVFHSPVVHTPQVGRPIVVAYLTAADRVLANDSFGYVRAIADPASKEAVLEFALVLDGVQVNGVDIIRWNDADLITDFKVMVRPLKAINKVWEEMGRMLEAMQKR